MRLLSSCVNGNNVSVSSCGSLHTLRYETSSRGKHFHVHMSSRGCATFVWQEVSRQEEPYEGN